MELTVSSVLAVLDELRVHRGDRTDVEVKRAAGGLPAKIGQTLCAFANMPDQGLLILGVNEAGGFSLSGVADPAGMEQALVNVAREAVTPSPYIDVRTLDIDGVQILAALVHSVAPRLKPARFEGRAYLRQADGDFVMGPADLRMIEVAALHHSESVHYDERPVTGTSLDDLDPALVGQVVTRARNQSRRLRELADAQIIRQLGAVTASGECTVAGIYALGNYPQGVLPPLRVTAAVRLPDDGSGVRTQNLQHFDGPITDLLDDCVAWVRQNLTTRQVYGPDGHMRDEPEIPLAAVREAVANALVHRDLGPETLGIGRSIDIRMTDRALVIASPGGLRGVTLPEIESPSPRRAAVNQRLYQLATHLHLPDGSRVIEGEGGGVVTMLRRAVDADLKRPTLTDNGVRFTATFWRGSAFSEEERRYLAGVSGGSSLTHLQKHVLLKAWHGERWDIDSLRAEFSPLPLDDAQAQLQALVRRGLLDADISAEVPFRVPAGSPGKRSEQPTRTAPPDPVHAHGPDGEHPDLRRLGKNVPAIHRVLSGGPALHADLQAATGLSYQQVRYALRALIKNDLVAVDGGQGHRGTTYRLVCGHGSSALRPTQASPGAPGKLA